MPWTDSYWIQSHKPRSVSFGAKIQIKSLFVCQFFLSLTSVSVCVINHDKTHTHTYTYTLWSVTELYIIEEEQLWFHLVEPYSGSCVSFPHQSKKKKTIIDFPVFLWCQICCRLSSSNLSLSFFPPSLHPSFSLPLFVLLINFITLIAPHCLCRKQLPSLPPSAHLSSLPSPLFPSLVAESSN